MLLVPSLKHRVVKMNLSEKKISVLSSFYNIDMPVQRHGNGKQFKDWYDPIYVQIISEMVILWFITNKIIMHEDLSLDNELTK